MVRLLVVIICLLIRFSLIAQNLEFRELTKLPSQINSAGEESLPLLAGDGQRIYFTRTFYMGNVGGEYAGQDVWSSARTRQGWAPSENKKLPFNDRNNNVVVGTNREGNMLYLLNSTPSQKLDGFYFTMFKNNKWSRPEFVPLSGIENQDFVGMWISPDFDVILLSMQGADSFGEEDLYIALKDAKGLWSRPRNLGPTINTKGFEISPYLSADKKRLYFSSNGHKGLGDADIFYCDRLYNSWETWSAPTNLGPVVNSKRFDAYFSIYGDSLALFTSNRDGQLSDIYEVKVSVGLGVLPEGQRYLTANDWSTIVGKSVSPQIRFEPGATALNSAQRELLYYIGNKVSQKGNVGIQLIVREEEDPELSRIRLKNIYGDFRQAGLDAGSIKDEQLSGQSTPSTKGTIEIILFQFDEPRP